MDHASVPPSAKGLAVFRGACLLIFAACLFLFAVKKSAAGLITNIQLEFDGLNMLYRACRPMRRATECNDD